MTTSLLRRLFLVFTGVSDVVQLICLVPSNLSSWLSLLVATVSSVFFLLRNLTPFVVVSAKKQAALLLGGVG